MMVRITLRDNETGEETSALIDVTEHEGYESTLNNFTVEVDGITGARDE